MKRSFNIIDQFVGSCIIFKRNILFITEAKLAEYIGITPDHLQKYESGEIRVSAKHLQKIAIMLKVSPAFFFDDLVMAQFNLDIDNGRGEPPIPVHPAPNAP